MDSGKSQILSHGSAERFKSGGIASRHSGAALNFTAALLVPILLHTVWMLLITAYPESPLPRFRHTWYGLVLSCSGFIFVIRQLRWWSLAIAVFYLPGMVFLLAWISMFITLVVKGSVP